jgi:hypothetical protein
MHNPRQGVIVPWESALYNNRGEKTSKGLYGSFTYYSVARTRW